MDKNITHTNYLGKGIATLALAGICGYLLYLTGGQHGIGWFCFGLFLIWGC